MKVSKNQLKNLLAQLVDELPIPDEPYSELNESEAAAIKQAALNGLSGILAKALWSTAKVVCKLPNNVHMINKIDAIQCPVCQCYFCESHKLIFCPVCNATL